MRVWILVGVALAFCFTDGRVYAFEYTKTPSDISIKWPTGAKVDFAINPKNSSGLSANSIYSVAVQAMKQWHHALQGLLNFDLFQGTDVSLFEPNSKYNGVSSIYFASNANDSAPGVDSDVLGLTQVWYSVSTGQIMEADIVLNDRNYQFTDVESDTAGYGSVNHPYGPDYSGKVFLGNVLTHEMGHTIGLAHSSNTYATMLFMEAPDQSLVSCDDRTAVQNLYSTPFKDGAGNSTGSIDGVISNAVAGNQAFQDQQLYLISLDRQQVMQSVAIEKSGHFRVSQLAAGRYGLLIQTKSSGNAYVSTESTSQSQCGGSFLFYGNASGGLTSVDVRVGGENHLGSIGFVCANQVGAFVPLSRNPVAVITEDSEASITHAGGEFKVTVIGTSIQNTVSWEMTLLSDNGTVVGRSQPVLEASTGLTIFDSQISADSLPPGQYRLQLVHQSLYQSQLPGGPTLAKSDSNAIVMLSSGQASESTDVITSHLGAYPYAPKCRLADTRENYSGPSASFQRQVTASKSSVGFCGSIERKIDRSRASGRELTAGLRGTIGLGVVIGWAFPFWSAALWMLRRRVYQKRGDFLNRRRHYSVCAYKNTFGHPLL